MLVTSVVVMVLVYDQILSVTDITTVGMDLMKWIVVSSYVGNWYINTALYVIWHKLNGRHNYYVICMLHMFDTYVIDVVIATSTWIFCNCTHWYVHVLPLKCVYQLVNSFCLKYIYFPISLDLTMSISHHYNICENPTELQMQYKYKFYVHENYINCIIKII